MTERPNAPSVRRWMQEVRTMDSSKSMLFSHDIARVTRLDTITIHHRIASNNLYEYYPLSSLGVLYATPLLSI